MTAMITSAPACLALQVYVAIHHHSELRRLYIAPACHVVQCTLDVIVYTCALWLLYMYVHVGDMCETGPCENYESTANESYCLNDGVCSNVVSESQVAHVMSDSPVTCHASSDRVKSSSLSRLKRLMPCRINFCLTGGDVRVRLQRHWLRRRSL